MHILRGFSIGATIRMKDKPFALPGRRLLIARFSAKTSVSWLKELLSAQPTTIRENRSMTTVKYNQPVRVAKYMIFNTQALLGAGAVKLRSGTLGDAAK